MWLHRGFWLANSFGMFTSFVHHWLHSKLTTRSSHSSSVGSKLQVSPDTTIFNPLNLPVTSLPVHRWNVPSYTWWCSGRNCSLPRGSVQWWLASGCCHFTACPGSLSMFPYVWSESGSIFTNILILRIFLFLEIFLEFVVFLEWLLE